MSLQSFALIYSGAGDRGSGRHPPQGGRGSSRGGRGGRDAHGSHSEWKYSYCGAPRHIDDYCWYKQGRPAYANQASNDSSQPASKTSPVAPFTSMLDSHDHMLQPN